MTDRCVLGIDTSNYTTSVSLIRGDEVVSDIRRLLKVRQGQRGLRQSEALFQHVQNLPELLAELRTEYDGNIDAVAYSTRPRAVEGSYMPCFTAGRSQAIGIAAGMNVPAIGFSHQEGHIEAVMSSLDERSDEDFLACHFSGGTCEVLRVKPHDPERISSGEYDNIIGERLLYDIEITGGTKDISFGQVLDRAGVDMGLDFPCGQALDNMALSAAKASEVLTPVRVRECFLNLSGFDTQLRNNLKKAVSDEDSKASLIREAFEKISASITDMLTQCAQKNDINNVYMSGGVSSSRFIREHITGKLSEKGISICFASPHLSSDNAVGTAFAAKRLLWG